MESRRILVVDDSSLVLHIMEDLLSAVPGVEVARAGSGAEALSRLTGPQRWDQVFLDIEMPGINGIQVLETLQGQGRLSGQKIAVLSGEVNEELHRRLAALGVQTVLTKPVDPQTLYALVGAPGTRGSGEAQQPPLWPPSLDYSAVLRMFSGDRALFDRSLAQFIGEYGHWTRRSSLEGAFPDLKELRFFLHTVKGLAAFLGATAVAREAGDLQKSLVHAVGPLPRGEGFLGALRAFQTEASRYLQTLVPTQASVSEVRRQGSVPTILIVDDQEMNRSVLREALKADYRVLEASGGAQALALCAEEHPDLILMDVVMPGMSGLEACQALKSQEETRDIPVIFVTSQDSAVDEERGFQAGGVDYIHKPANPPIIRVRVKIHLRLSDQKRALEHLVEERTRQIQEIQHEVVNRLSIASEYKDSDTGLHILRIGRYAEVLARGLGVPAGSLAAYRDAASLHDIGKIGIPDAILLKPGKLDDEEWAIMKTHTTIGARMLADLPQSLFQLSAASALSHHEKWDGSGYPQGLKGKEIPLVGRIVAVCDVFDALMSDRPYKKAWPLAQALDFLEQGRGTHFDPEVLDVFFASRDQMVVISGDR